MGNFWREMSSMSFGGKYFIVWSSLILSCYITVVSLVACMCRLNMYAVFVSLIFAPFPTETHLTHSHLCTGVDDSFL